MPLATYTDLTAAIGSWLQRSDIAALFPTFVQLFEACANRRLRVRQQEAIVELTPSNGVVALPAEMGVYLVGQYRYATACYSWEIVAGYSGADEAPLAAAQRELADFFRSQAEECLALAKATKGGAALAELVSLAAMLHERAVQLEKSVANSDSR